ncbi:MAG: MBL fold metallo-hydrolase [Phycisphaeraceae bacterium]|nr:MBL fold metallo-hydrolase [Phycisphaeraceae bacterium]
MNTVKQPFPPTRYSWRLLRAGEFRLDGGSMFGLVPRVVWSKSVPTDDRGRITVQHNCLLLERSGPGDGPKLILLEAGTGDKLDAKSRDIFALEQRSIVDALHEADCRPEDINAAIVTHLHFDHAGGLTRLCRAGEKPDWAEAGTAGVKLTFPSATVFTQAREWNDALANRSVMTRTYFRDHLEPIRSQVRLVDSPRPFPFGYTPDRDETPMTPVSLRTTEVAPGLFVFLVPGHTWGQQAMMFTDTQGRTVVFTPDVMPTAAHVGAAYSLGYDVEPYTSMISRRWFLEEAATGNWLLVLDHEPGNPLRAVRRTGEGAKGWFELVEAG